eukprot:gene2018-2295_t
MGREDNDKVREEFKTIIGWTIAELHEDFGWMKKYLPSRIGHEYMKETATKSEQVVWHLLYDKDSNVLTGSGDDDDQAEPTAYNSFICDACGKSYKRRGNLRNHLRDAHVPKNVSVDDEEHVTTQPSKSSVPNSVLLYSSNALALGLLALDFEDARQHADGEPVDKRRSLQKKAREMSFCLSYFPFKHICCNRYSYLKGMDVKKVKTF